MFLVSGIGGLILTSRARQMPGFWWSLISAVLAIGAGIILLAQPVQGTLTLTIVVSAYFLAEGVATIMYALERRRELSERWSWLAAGRRADGYPDRSRQIGHRAMSLLCQHRKSRGYSINPSARCWREKGTSRPSAPAVLRLIISSNLTGA